jgi:hypothetical protein
MFCNLVVFIHRINFPLILIPSTVIQNVFFLYLISPINYYLSCLKNFKCFFLIPYILNLKLILFKNNSYLYENKLNLYSKHIKKS